MSAIHDRFVGAATAIAFIVAAGPLAAQRAIPLRALSPALATDSGALASIAEVRHLRDGRVLVNDAVGHRLLAFDSTLRGYTTVLGAAGSPAPYGSQRGVLISYPGDSSIFLDVDASAFVVLDPAARVVRTMAMPRATDLIWLTRGEFGYGRPQTDIKGRLLYGGRRPLPPNAMRPPADTSGKTTITIYPDSAPLLRADFETRTVDTVIMFRVPVQKAVTVNQGGTVVSSLAVNPVPSTDDWTVLPDGTIAIARAYDYHIDWLMPDGTRKSSPKMAFDWRRITLEDKEHILDSVRKQAGAFRAKQPSSPPRIVNGRPMPSLPFTTVEPSDLPDFYPPIRPNQVRADSDGHVWILPATSSLAGSGLVWDIINREGEVFERVQLPEGCNIVGFGPGIVYISHPTPGGVVLERARVVPQK